MIGTSRLIARRSASSLLCAPQRVRCYASNPPPTPPPTAAKSQPEPAAEPQPTALEGPPTSPTFGSSLSVAAAQADLLPLPFLAHPLGVEELPKGEKQTWGEKRAALLDQDRRMQNRKSIVKEASRGYFSDFHAMTSHGGKTWRAPSTLIRSDRALYFPAIAGTRLSDSEKKNTANMLPGKVSVVALLTSTVSDEHAKSFHAPTVAAYKDNPNFQLVQNLELQREAMGIHNKHVGYTYLVAPDGRIRWAGSAFAEKAEQDALVACTGVLLNRLKENAGASK